MGSTLVSIGISSLGGVVGLFQSNGHAHANPRFRTDGHASSCFGADGHGLYSNGHTCAWTALRVTFAS